MRCTRSRKPGSAPASGLQAVAQALCRTLSAPRGRLGWLSVLLRTVSGHAASQRHKRRYPSWTPSFAPRGRVIRNIRIWAESEPRSGNRRMSKDTSARQRTVIRIISTLSARSRGRSAGEHHAHVISTMRFGVGWHDARGRQLGSSCAVKVRDSRATRYTPQRSPKVCWMDRPAPDTPGSHKNAQHCRT